MSAARSPAPRWLRMRLPPRYPRELRLFAAPAVVILHALCDRRRKLFAVGWLAESSRVVRVIEKAAFHEHRRASCEPNHGELPRFRPAIRHLQPRNDARLHGLGKSRT